MHGMKLYRTLKFLMGWLIRLIFNLKITGAKGLPRDGAYILCANHISNIDPILIAAAHKRPVRYMGKAELFEVPVLRRLLRWLGAFPVKRGESDQEAIKKSFSILEDGGVMGMFPEGTRSKDGELLKLKSGAAMIAYKMKVPVLTVAIYTKKGRVHPFKRTAIRFGELTTIEELGLAEGTTTEIRAATRLIADKIAALREELI